VSDTHFDDPPAATTRRGLLGIGGATALATFAGVGLWPQPLEAAPVQPWINVTDPPFNALGNHDPFGTPGFDNTTAIQNALNALPITGGALHFPPGTTDALASSVRQASQWRYSARDGKSLR
jgi:hypothetical protein